jgi:hypothetical protein
MNLKGQMLLALLIAYGAAQAAEWVSITTTTDKTYEVFVDVSSLQRSGEITRAWVKLLYVPHTQRGAADDSSKWKSYSVLRYAHNCSEGSNKLEALAVYYEDGTQWASPPEIIAKSTWEPVIPETVADGVMKFACSRKPK